jgi:hypothetical protein
MMKYIPFEAGSSQLNGMQPLLVRLMNIAERPAWARPLSFIGFGHSVLNEHINLRWEKNRAWYR